MGNFWERETLSRDTPTVIRHGDRACADVPDPSVFYPVKESWHRDTMVALAICGRCPHQFECLRWALETEQAYGIWGGVEEKDRRSMITKLREDAARRRFDQEK